MTTAVARMEPAAERIDHPIAHAIMAAAPQFAPFLPAGTDVGWVAAQVFLEVQRTPALARCTPASIVSAATRLVSWGFDIGRTGYLVPFKDRASGDAIATPVPGYKGFIELVLATGAARSCEAREVRTGDFFEYEYGTNGHLRHTPGLKGPRGKVTDFYVLWVIKFGVVKFDVMTLDEVEDVRLRYSKQWGKEKWARGECEPWYGCKTVIRKSAKQLPQNPKLAKFFAALQEDETAELGTPLFTGTKPEDAPDTSDGPAAPAPVAPTFEEEGPPRASVLDVTLPAWPQHPLGGKAIREVATDELVKLCAQLRDTGNRKWTLLCEAIDAELEARRDEPA